MKRCNKCKIDKPLNAFSKHSGYSGGYNARCKKCRAEYQAAYRNKYPEKIKEQRNKYYKNNKDSILARDKVYYEKNRDKIIKQKTEYDAKRRKIDINYKISSNLRSRLYMAIRKNYKAGSAVRDLGCSIAELKAHLESKFEPGMTWDNYGDWHIDHIKPLSSFDLTDSDEIRLACNYTNLQPLWAKDNIIKGNQWDASSKT